VTGYLELSPRIDYHVRFAKKEQHWFWVRAHGPHYTADSIHAALDFKEEEWGQHIDTGWGGGYKWTTRGPFQITAPGVHTLSIWMREDGTIVDKLLLTARGDYKPSEELDAFNVPVGEGPPESPRRSSA
jgi:hypothetical protein